MIINRHVIGPVVQSILSVERPVFEILGDLSRESLRERTERIVFVDGHADRKHFEEQPRGFSELRSFPVVIRHRPPRPVDCR